MPVLDTNTFNAQTLFPARNSAAVADTGASVDCSWIEMLKMMGIGRRLLLPSSTVLCTANKQRMTVMGLVPVIIGQGDAERGAIQGDAEHGVQVHTVRVPTAAAMEGNKVEPGVGQAQGG